METNKPDYVYDNVIQIDDADSSRKFLANVFTWMFAALGISALAAFAFATTPALLANASCTTCLIDSFSVNECIRLASRGMAFFCGLN